MAPNALQIAWALGLVAWIVCVFEQVRGVEQAPRDLKLKLRQLNAIWPTPRYMAFAYHEAPDPARARLRRAAVAQITFLLCFAVGATSMLGAKWFLAFLPVAFAAYVAFGLLRRP